MKTLDMFVSTMVNHLTWKAVVESEKKEKVKNLRRARAEKKRKDWLGIFHFMDWEDSSRLVENPKEGIIRRELRLEKARQKQKDWWSLNSIMDWMSTNFNDEYILMEMQEFEPCAECSKKQHFVHCVHCTAGSPTNRTVNSTVIQYGVGQDRKLGHVLQNMCRVFEEKTRLSCFKDKASQDKIQPKTRKQIKGGRRLKGKIDGLIQLRMDQYLKKNENEGCFSEQKIEITFLEIFWG
jgi:hypothetical protein